MGGKPHPYYAGLVRIIEAHPERWTVSSFAIDAGLNNATIRVGLRSGSEPSAATIVKVRALIGLDYDGVINWNGEMLGDETKTLELNELSQIGQIVSMEDRRILLAIARKLILQAPGRAPEEDDGDGV